MPEFSEQTGFIGLFVSAFVSATLMPGGSEAVLVAVLHRFPEAFWRAVAVATVGNTLGAMSSYLIGRVLPNRATERSLDWMRRHGHWALLFSWLPVVGDGFCVAAGWLRLDPWRCAALIGAGKLARYLIVAGGWVWLEGLFN